MYGFCGAYKTHTLPCMVVLLNQKRRQKQTKETLHGNVKKDEHA